MRLLFVINPVSGGNDKTGWEQAIYAYCQAFAHTASLLLLTGTDDAVRLHDRIRAFGPDRVVAVGGDGTVKLVAEQVVGTPIPMGILPAGSANGVALELAIPLTAYAALTVITTGRIRLLDTICINKKDLCLHLSDIGMNAQLVSYYKQNNWRGKLGYARSLIGVLLHRRRLDVRIELGGQTICRTARMVVLANGRCYGTGARINPSGDPADGLFEVIIVRRLSVWAFLSLFWRHQPFDPVVIEIIPTTAVHLITRRKTHFQVDGEYRGRVTEVQATIRPRQLQMLVPAA